MCAAISQDNNNEWKIAMFRDNKNIDHVLNRLKAMYWVSLKEKKIRNCRTFNRGSKIYSTLKLSIIFISINSNISLKVKSFFHADLLLFLLSLHSFHKQLTCRECWVSFSFDFTMINRSLNALCRRNGHFYIWKIVRFAFERVVSMCRTVCFVSSAVWMVFWSH